MEHVDFYFDFISPYAYFATLKVAELCDARAIPIRWHPILFAGVLHHHGQLGPAEIPAKRRFTFQDVARYAILHEIPLVGPPAHPFNPLPALRLCVPDVAGDHQRALIRRLYRACWSEGQDLEDPAVLTACLTDVGLSPTALAQTQTAPVKEALIQSTQTAIARGVFGVPTALFRGQLFWGNDRLDHLALLLDGTDLLAETDIDTILARPQRHRRRP